MLPTRDTKGQPKHPPMILIVDDEDFICDLFQDILEEEGYKIETASNGEEAFEKASKIRFDLIISDIVMPGMDGMELLQRLKEMGTESEVIIITGYGSIETAVKAIKLGAADYLTKPLNVDLIRIIVTKTLQKREVQKLADEAQYYKELSRLDSMTGLFNHQAFHNLLEAEISRAARQGHNLSLLMLDIDNFKQYNDTYGHLAGDALLKKVSNLLRTACRSYDLIARYGGDEFSVIAPETNKTDAGLLAKRLAYIGESRRFLTGESMPGPNISLSIGIATYPVDASTKNTLVIKADQALYQAKSSGKNITCLA